MPGTGPTDAKVALLGQGPGEVEAALGVPFVGLSGQLLDKLLAAARLPRSTLWIDNVVRCHLPGNRAPKGAEVEHCRTAHWAPALGALPQLRVVVTAGVPAARALLGPKATESVVGSVRKVTL